jgi:hypothetical protein
MTEGGNFSEARRLLLERFLRDGQARPATACSKHWPGMRAASIGNPIIARLRSSGILSLAGHSRNRLRVRFNSASVALSLTVPCLLRS